MYSCLIVEDDPIFVDQLRAYLAQTTLFESPLVCSTAMDAFMVLTTKNVDLLILDYDLPGMTGLELIQGLTNLPPVIMTTVYSSHAATCYDLDAVVDFLVKPFDYMRFFRGIRRALAALPQLTENKPVEPLPVVDEKKHMFFKSGRKLNRFVLDDILYAEAYGTYIKVYTLTGPVIINQRLKTLENELPGDRFVRIHKSFIINVQHLSHLEAHQVQVSAKKFPIGVTYRPSVLQFMQQAGVLGTSN
ncbi:LytR/AlgR family response regulator transcription factor [Spirosoma foliorum]|uniref:Response regulator transcription factor n=1 Tax=Spirosoma foliorum TaxID=2710596 RepID=A0A7G5GU34_9BACT|nr:LytTR family DNA-binding domain-containing protein [Spirosoma foliorum]QMW02376.1 response regulator transcription factor [Spirosoma foliorum]